MQGFIKRSECVALTGLSLTTIWRLEQAGSFPKRRKLSAGRVGWLHEEVIQWINSRETYSPTCLAEAKQ